MYQRAAQTTGRIWLKFGIHMAIMPWMSDTKGFLEIQPPKDKIRGCKNTTVAPPMQQNQI